MNRCNQCYWRLYLPKGYFFGELWPAYEVCTSPKHPDGKLIKDCKDFRTTPTVTQGKARAKAMNKRYTLYDLSLKVLQVAESGKAILVTEGLRDKEGRQINHWLPLSQIEPSSPKDYEIGKVHQITIPQWLVEEKNLTVD